jgi:hypothetical protein
LCVSVGDRRGTKGMVCASVYVVCMVYVSVCGQCLTMRWVREREIGRQRNERDACHTTASHRRIPHAPHY